jgi:hypothetical protein
LIALQKDLEVGQLMLLALVRPVPFEALFKYVGDKPPPNPAGRRTIGFDFSRIATTVSRLGSSDNGNLELAWSFSTLTMRKLANDLGVSVT